MHTIVVVFHARQNSMIKTTNDAQRKQKQNRKRKKTSPKCETNSAIDYIKLTYQKADYFVFIFAGLSLLLSVKTLARGNQKYKSSNICKHGLI